jgi:hypothetical protein
MDGRTMNNEAGVTWDMDMIDGRKHEKRVGCEERKRHPPNLKSDG